MLLYKKLLLMTFGTTLAQRMNKNSVARTRYISLNHYTNQCTHIKFTHLNTKNCSDMFRSLDHHQGAAFLCLAKVTLKATLKPVIN